MNETRALIAAWAFLIGSMAGKAAWDAIRRRRHLRECERWAATMREIGAKEGNDRLRQITWMDIDRSLRNPPPN
jgi:hypothetical protein